VLICIDEKTGIQAKRRKYPEQAARRGRAARREFEYIRNGTVSIIAPHLNIRLIMDNGSSHVSRAARAWIAARPRITVTCTPVHASRLDMAELWFSVLTRALLRRGEFTSRAGHTRYQARHAPPRPAPSP
jgi:DDE superfamily endonuclease